MAWNRNRWEVEEEEPPPPFRRPPLIVGGDREPLRGAIIVYVSYLVAAKFFVQRNLSFALSQVAAG